MITSVNAHILLLEELNLHRLNTKAAIMATLLEDIILSPSPMHR